MLFVKQNQETQIRCGMLLKNLGVVEQMKGATQLDDSIPHRCEAVIRGQELGIPHQGVMKVPSTAGWYMQATHNYTGGGGPEGR